LYHTKLIQYYSSRITKAQESMLEKTPSKYLLVKLTNYRGGAYLGRDTQLQEQRPHNEASSNT
jgi:hypothetical protein